MIIGIAKENRERDERRVILLPQYIKLLKKDNNHKILVEKNAGIKLSISNKEYENAGAIISSQKEVYSADLLMRIRVPTLDELNLMKPNSLLACMVHRDTHPEMREEFKKRKIKVIELNELKNKYGKRLVEAFEISSTEGIKKSFKLFKKLYKKSPEKILFMGYGNIAIPAIRTACRMGGIVTVLGRKQTTRNNIKKNLKGQEIIFNAIYRKPSEIGKYLITKNDLMFLNKNSLIVDLSADPISYIETCHPTTLDKPYYFKTIGGRRTPHMCIYSLPGLKPLECSKRYGEQLIPFIKLIANSGLNIALKQSLPLRKALIS